VIPRSWSEAPPKDSDSAYQRSPRAAASPAPGNKPATLLSLVKVFDLTMGNVSLMAIGAILHAGDMNLLVVVLVPIFIGLIGALILTLHKISLFGTRMPVTTDWIDALSPEHYRPMLRLLDRADFEFIRSQPGCTRRTLAVLRRQRVQVFRGYLNELSRDFGRTCAAVRILLAQSNTDRPDLASTLVRSQLTFALGMVAVQVRVGLFSLGIGTVSGADLVRLLDGLRIELRTLVPASIPVGV
jgi:hypothetical protein